jgi:hemerythrin-like domain-containing protein
MNSQRQVNHVLDDEHQASVDLMRRMEGCVQSSGVRAPEFAQIAAALARHIERDIGRHFDFEERELFPRLEAAGEGDIIGLLMEEHVAIREVAAELLPRLHSAAAGTLDTTGGDALKRGALEMVERLVAHIQKETTVLLPMLDDHLDDETDRALAQSYATT